MTAFLAVKFPSALTFICASLLASGWAQNVLDNSNISACKDNQFTCASGDCIMRELLCDGRADCKDQSDETQVECTKPELTCPDYAFRCTYGACVNLDSICNGVRDCLDNSDETLPRCPGISNRDPDEVCNSEDYRCRNGQCIDSVGLCDGTIDCADGSDETFTNCGSFPCRQSVFRCNYGACINNDRKCDNVSHCADGSDEDSLLCGRPGPGPSTIKPLTISPRPSPRPTQGSVLPNKPPALLCSTPAQPTNGQWRVDKSLCGDTPKGEIGCEFASGIELDPGTSLIYTCASGYTLRGSPVVYCGRDGYWSKIPVCIRITCSPLESPSTSANCNLRSTGWVSCSSEVLPWTSAKISCKPGYRKDPNAPPTHGDDLDCNEAGKWVPEPISCIPGPLVIYVEVDGAVIRVKAKVANNATGINLIDVTNDKVIVYTGMRGNSEIEPNIEIKLSAPKSDGRVFRNSNVGQA